MSIRVADNMMFEQVNRNLQKNRQDMGHLQNQAATQKRVTKPSDDPVAASRVLSSRVEDQGISQYSKNLTYAKAFLDFTDQSLGELTDYLVRAKELAIGQSNDASADKRSRRVVATEIEQIYNQVVKVSNRKLGDRFIFGGYKTTERPFDIQGKYLGDAGEMLIHIDKGSFLGMNIPGNKIFIGRGLSSDGVSHSVATQAMTIEELMESQGRGDELQRQEDQVETEDRAGAGRKGGPMPIRMRGPASEQGGAPKAQQDEFDHSNEVSNQDGGINLFGAVKKLEVALKTNDKLSVQESLDNLDRAIEQVVLGRAQVGSRVTIIDNALNTMSKNKIDNKVFASELEDVDAFKVISDMNKTEGTLKATLQTSGKLIMPSLMQFLG